MRKVIKGGRVLDPATGLDEVCDIVVEDGRIAGIGRGLGPAAGGDDAFIVQAEGLLVMPGFIDLHCHLRTPGEEWKEDIASGTRAAAAGGYTTICCMPNTKPALDNGAMMEFIRNRAQAEGVVRVNPIGCITKGRKGESLAEIGEMVEAGAVAVSDDGSPVMNPELMRCALQYARMFGVPVSVHAEDTLLAAGGVVNLGRMSTVLGLKGIPAEAESVMVARDIQLAALTGAHLHVAHVSSAKTVELIRDAKRRGVKVTAEVTPHHLTLTEEAVQGYNTYAKCSPPLRSEEDRQALIAALADGAIDVIATDHAPHHRDDKEVEFDRAAFGISGLETAFSLVMTELVEKGRLSLRRAVECLTVAPAQIFGLEGGSLSPGAPADIVVADPGQSWVVDPSAFASKGKNTPYGGRQLKGRVIMTIAGGKVVYQAKGAGLPAMAGDIA